MPEVISFRAKIDEETLRLIRKMDGKR